MTTHGGHQFATSSLHIYQPTMNDPPCWLYIRSIHISIISLHGLVREDTRGLSEKTLVIFQLINAVTVETNCLTGQCLTCLTLT